MWFASVSTHASTRMPTILAARGLDEETHTMHPSQRRHFLTRYHATHLLSFAGYLDCTLTVQVTPTPTYAHQAARAIHRHHSESELCMILTPPPPPVAAANLAC